MKKVECEVFNQNKCLGCQAQENLNNLEKVKKYCEIYKEMKNGK